MISSYSELTKDRSVTIHHRNIRALAIEIYKVIYKFTISTPLLKSDSHLPKKICVICLIESPLKTMKNAFYFILKALFILKLFKFLS